MYDDKFTTNFRKKITTKLNTDIRSISEIAERKKPKIELLNAINDSIKLLFNHLYSVTEQLILINNSLGRKLSISETTYLKFLNEYMLDEYIVYKKNRYFASRYSQIKEVSSEFKEYELQYMNLNFSGFINGKTRLDLTLDDYISFMKNYYEKEDENYYKKSINTTTKKEKVLNINPNGGKKYTTKKVKADDLSILTAPGSDTQKTKAATNKEKLEVNESTNNYQDTNIKTSNETKCDVLPGIDIDNIPKQFEIIEDLDLLPEEVNNKEFKFGKINLETDKIEEDYVFFHHRLLIQCVDPKSYNLRDGLLIVTDTIREKDYNEGYLFFRYYQGKFYLIEHFKTPFGSPTLNRDLNTWANENCTKNLNSFYKEFFNKYSKGRNVDE